MKITTNTIEDKKTKAIELMKQLDIYKPYINGFKKDGYVCYFERFAGFWDFQDKELEAKRKEIEKEYNCLVYATTHEYVDGDEMYSYFMQKRVILPANSRQSLFSSIKNGQNR